MYRKDLITAEIEKLALVLARIMGLKAELKLDDANQLFEETLAHSFGLPIDTLYTNNLSLFENWLLESELQAEKLDSLSEFLYNELATNAHKAAVIAPKLNLVYERLSNHFRIVHLVNLHRQKMIQQYL